MPRGTLLADVGGSRARFAFDSATGQHAALELSTRDFPTFRAALDRALSGLGAAQAERVAVCAAGPPRDGAIALTNRGWVVSEQELRTACRASRVLLVNDFTALAAALPSLEAADLETVARGACVEDATRAVIGAGTGLGVSALVPGDGGETLITGEGGHVDLAAGSREEQRIVARLRERFGHVSAERVLSGPGLSNLYAAMHPDDAPAPPPDPAAISAAARAGDAAALACIGQFCAFLGAVAGDVALILGARGGIYLAGGIVPAWGTLFDRRTFRQRFEDKGRYRDYLRAIPAYIIVARHPALRGLARLLARCDSERRDPVSGC
jgi:glucokinase